VGHDNGCTAGQRGERIHVTQGAKRDGPAWLHKTKTVEPGLVAEASKKLSGLGVGAKNLPLHARSGGLVFPYLKYTGETKWAGDSPGPNSFSGKELIKNILRSEMF